MKPIAAKDARRIVKQYHYSGKVVNNSQLHLGVFLDGRCGGAMQFGPSLDKRKIQGLVKGTKFNGFLELNRMAFADWLPRNSESRALSVAMRLIRKHYPHIEWIVSFADATQCGDGTIYRAAGFALTSIKPNNQIWQAPSGEQFSSQACRNVDHHTKEHNRAVRLVSRTTHTKGSHIKETGASSMRVFKDAGWKPLPGHQLRYLYFVNPSARERLTVPILPYSEIDARGARMYKGKRAASIDSDASGDQPGEGGASPTAALHSAELAAG